MPPDVETAMAVDACAGCSSDFSLLTPQDLYLFNEGRHFRAYDRLGAHLIRSDEVSGTSFSVWAPNAREVSVIGSFNDWEEHRHTLSPLGTSGIWEVFVPDAKTGGFVQVSHSLSVPGICGGQSRSVRRAT